MEEKEIMELAEKLKATGGNVYTVINHLQAELEKVKELTKRLSDILSVDQYITLTEKEKDLIDSILTELEPK
jgi:orotate phosphoribosyltransferase